MDVPSASSFRYLLTKLGQPYSTLILASGRKPDNKQARILVLSSQLLSRGFVGGLFTLVAF